MRDRFTSASADSVVGCALADATLDRFTEMYEFLFRWSGRGYAPTDADRDELLTELEQRWLAAEIAAVGLTDSTLDLTTEPTNSAIVRRAVAKGLPAWFQNRVGELLEPPEDYLFLKPAADSNEIGRLGGYSVLRVVSKGGMGVVFEGVLAGDDENRLIPKKHVAIKTIRPELHCPAMVARLIVEARALNGLDSHHVVRVVDADYGDTVPYIVMEYVAGVTLYDLIDHHTRVPMTLCLAVDLIRQAARGLEDIHAYESVKAHRDLKPANVLLERVTASSACPNGWRVRICDVGLALPAEGARHTPSGFAVGSKGYRAPEQLPDDMVDGDPVDGKCDIFALGIIAYQLLTGEHPFDFDEKFPKPRPPFPDAIPPDLRACVGTMLEMDPAERRGAADVINELNEVDRGLAAPAPVRRPRAAAWKSVIPRIRPGQIVLWTSVLVVVAIGITVAAVTLNKPGEGTPGVNAVPVNRYRGKIDVLIPRTMAGGRSEILRLDSFGALPLRLDDQFQIVAEVDPPAFLYVFWVEPDGVVAPVYPWDTEHEDWVRPSEEEPRSRLRLPDGMEYKITNDLAGVTTIVLLARPTRLDVPDDVVKKWFAHLPTQPLPDGEQAAAVYFDDYNRVVGDPLRAGVLTRVESANGFQRWQSALKSRVAAHAIFQTAVNFARTKAR